jgi:hypothetical protein
MKIRILEPVMLPGGVGAKPGEIVDVSEGAAFNIISVGRGVELKAPAAEKAAEATKVEVREPKAETRDPEPTKGKRRE